MALPDAIFIDTNIFERQHFNFAGLALTSFAQSCRRHGLPLLLPDPIERELKRHVRDAGAKAHELLLKARRIAPFLETSRHDARATLSESSEYNRKATNALDSYLMQFQVVRLGYDGLNLNEVMGWYDTQTPPFGAAGKQKEFPDAFTIAIIEKYATESGHYVAVVSDDKGVGAACERYSKLSYFSELTTLSELLVNDAVQVEALKAIVESDTAELGTNIAAVAAELPFHHVDQAYEILSSQVLGARVLASRIVAIGHGECTITFVAEVDAEHELAWWEYETPDGDIELTEVLIEPSSVTGLAKLQVDHGSKRVTSVLLVELDQIALRVTENPTRYF